MENNWPETVEELLEECESLISRHDLYTLGKRGEPYIGETEPRVDGTEYLAGEYQYGVAMIPAQWVTHVISAATLGKQKAISHPYGYEPDTGAFDATRCECGCLNDISATYCNDCGGEIEVDMYADKEIYHAPRNSVFAEKHDDGSLEFGGKRYIAATLGREACEMTVIDTDNEAAYEHHEYIMHCEHCHFEFGLVQYNEDGDTWQDEKPNYCPNCGRKVVS